MKKKSSRTQYIAPATPMDPMDHPANSGHNDTFSPGRADMEAPNLLQNSEGLYNNNDN